MLNKFQSIISSNFKSSINDPEILESLINPILDISNGEDPYLTDYFLLDSIDQVTDPKEKEAILNDPSRTPIYCNGKQINKYTPEDLEACITKYKFSAFPNDEGKTIFELNNPYHNLEVLKEYIANEWAYIWDLNKISQSYQRFEYNKESQSLTIYLVSID